MLILKWSCALVLIGFESLDPIALKQMRKNWAGVAGSYSDVIARLHKRGIMIYGAFVFGYDQDKREAFRRTAEFAHASNLAIANFNPLTPMPGTALYARLERDGALLKPAWWNDPTYRYGEAIFEPKGMTTADLAAGPMDARQYYYSWLSILKRAWRGASLWRLRDVGIMVFASAISRREIRRKQASLLASEEPVA